MAKPFCYICGRWNDPTGGPDAHSGGCENTGKRYDGGIGGPMLYREGTAERSILPDDVTPARVCKECGATDCATLWPEPAGCLECGDVAETAEGLCRPCYVAETTCYGCGESYDPWRTSSGNGRCASCYN